MVVEFDIDVSGTDIFSRDYTIVVALHDHANTKIIYGYKLDTKTIELLRQNHRKNKYKYRLSKSQTALFKVRVYSIIIYNLFQKIYNKNNNLKREVFLHVCNDFDGHENDIKSNLIYLLKDMFHLEIKDIKIEKLPNDSNAHRYAFLMRNDRQNLMKENYVSISLEEIEKFLINIKRK